MRYSLPARFFISALIRASYLVGHGRAETGATAAAYVAFEHVKTLILNITLCKGCSAIQKGFRMYILEHTL